MVRLVPPSLVPPLAIVGLGLALFAGLVRHPRQALYSPGQSDLHDFHVPMKRFLVRSWQETGDLPLWCPYSFSGMPFIHDPQVAAFYPPHLPLYGLAPERAAAFLSWQVVWHVVLAGLGTYAYARHDGLGKGGAFVAAVGTMFAGKWVLHMVLAGHVNLAPLAWLPLVLLALDRALRRGSWPWAVMAGALFALIVTGTHPQFTLYAGLLAAVWSLRPAWEAAERVGPANRRWPRALGRWLGYGTLAAGTAVGLAAVQVLPSLEAATQATRATGGLGGLAGRDLGLTVLQLVGPAIPGGWEKAGGLAIVWVAVAALGLAGGGRARWYGAMALGLLFYALVGWVLVQRVPGLGFFRIPSRALVLVAMPLSLMAGLATDRLFEAAGRPAWLPRGLKAAALAAGAGLILLGVQACLLYPGRTTPQFRPQLYAAALAAALATGAVLLARYRGSPGPMWKAAWIGVLLLELAALDAPLILIRPAEEIGTSSAAAVLLADKGEPLARLLDRQPEAIHPAQMPVGTAAPLVLGLCTVRGYNPLDVRRYKEYVSFMGGARAAVRAGDTDLPSWFPVREQKLLDLLGVRYCVQRLGVPLEPGLGHPWTAGGPPRPGDDVMVYENPACLPRAFLVPEAVPLPAGEEARSVLASADFRRTVFLEDWHPVSPPGETPGEFRPAVVRAYGPNRVVLDAEATGPCFLVLTDPWYPGWTATVDGAAAAVHRADYAFRGVAVPGGRHEIVLQFEPASYARGRAVSLAALALLGVVGAAAGVRAWTGRKGRGADATRA